MGQSPPGHECGPGPGLPFLQGCAEFGKQYPVADQYCAYPPKAAPQGSILLSVRAPVGRLNRADREYGIGRGLCAIIPDNRHLLTDFAFYLFEARHGKLLASATGSTYDAVTVNDICNHSMTLPPISEQARITPHLDSVTADTDAAIASLQRQVELLAEQRRAMMWQVVTQGLDGGVPLRASGVPWLGSVPEHWNVQRLKQCAQLIMGQSPPGQECGPPPGRPFLQGCAEFGERHPVPEQTCERPPKAAPTGSILLSVRAPVGRLNRANAEYGIGRGLCAILPHVRDLHTDFAYYQLEALQEGLLASATGSTYDAVSVSDIGNHAVVLPPRAEQVWIASYLDRATADLKATVAGIKREIELLKEYRARLIADVVTGRLDVREAADNLPGPSEGSA